MLGIKPIQNNTKSWSKEELNILNIYYPKGGSILCKEKGLLRSQSAIVNKAYKMSLKYTSPRQWSSDDIELLKKYYNKGFSYLKEKGLDKSTWVIRTKAKELGLVDYSFWTEKELDILKTYYSEGVKVVKEKGVNKTEKAIYCKAHRLGLSKNKHIFTIEEEDLIKTYYPLGGSNYVKLRGLNLSISEIDKKAKDLQLVRYDENSPCTYKWGIEDTDIFIRYFILGGYNLCKEKGLTKNRIATMVKADQFKIRAFSSNELDVASDSSLTFDEKMNLIGNSRTIHEVRYVSEYSDIVKADD